MTLYLVTGGAGFIGSNISEELIKRGNQVRVIDLLTTGKEENLKDIINDIEFINGDIRDTYILNKAMEGVDYVLHQAALPSVPRSVADPIASNANNIDGTLNVLVAARDAGVRKVVCAASSSAYGDTPVLPKVEDMTPNPLSPYAVTKLVGEYYCKVFTNIYNLETVALRYFNVFGPKQDPNSQYAAVIPKFIELMLNGESPLIHGDGEQSRDFSYIENVISANILAAETPGVAGEVMNIACGDRITLNDLVKELNEILGTNIEPIHGQTRPGDVKHSLADISKAERLIGYKPLVNYKEGLKKTVAWYRAKNDK